MPLDLVPRLSLCSSDIVAPDVALRRLLLHSSFDFFHGSNFIPKRTMRHRSVEEGTLPPISKPRRRHQHQEQTTALQLCVQAVQVNSGPLCGDRPLTAEAEKKWPKLKKKFTFDQLYKVDEHYKSDGLPVWRFPWIQTTTQAFKEEKRHDDPSR